MKNPRFLIRDVKWRSLISIGLFFSRLENKNKEKEEPIEVEDGGYRPEW